MSIREAIKKLPAWKAVIIILLIGGFIFYSIEEIFISKIFHIFNSTIMNFGKQFKDDDDDLAQSSREYKEQDEYNKARNAIEAYEWKFDAVGVPYHDHICSYVIRNVKLKSLYQLNYAKHNAYIREALDKRIALFNGFINREINDTKFNPATCKDE